MGGREKILDLFLDTRGTAAALAQVVKLGAAHSTTALHGDAFDQRAVSLEDALYAFAVRHLTYRERGVNSAITLGDANAFESLQALALTFTHSDLHNQRIARTEFWQLDRGSIN